VLRLLALTLAATLGLTAVASAGVLVDFSRGGGFAGIPLHLTVTGAGKAQAEEGFQGQTGRRTLSARRLKSLKRQLRQTGFGSLRSSYAPKVPVSDGFMFVVTYRGKTVRTATGGHPPERLSKLIDRLSQMAQSIAQ